MVKPLVLAVALVAAGCLESEVTTCPSGVLCPPGSVCAEDRCVLPEQLDGCTGLDDAAACRYGANDGFCVGGVCVAVGCGDGVLQQTEQCEGDDLGGADCTDGGFYAAAGLACDRTRCLYDYAGCGGGWCGDGARNGDEACDVTVDDVACADLGYHGDGVVACTAGCNFDVADCGGYCGDGLVDEVEACDGAIADGDSCVARGDDLGHLACNHACGVVTDDCDRIGWEIVPSVTGATLWALWGSAADDLHAVGHDGTVLHFDGERWTVSELDGVSVLVDVWGSGPDDVFAVGTGTIVHYDGTTWSVMPGVPPTAGLTVVFGTGPSDVYAGGTNGALLHYDGTAWSSVTGVTTLSIQDIWASGPSDVYVSALSGVLRHFDGSTWTNAGPSSAETVWRIWGRGPGDVDLIRGNALYHYDGTSMTMSFAFPDAVSVRALFGVDDTLWVASGPVIYRREGTRWSRQDSGTLQSIFGLWGASADDVHAVGSTGLLLHRGANARSITRDGTAVARSGTIDGAGGVVAVGAAHGQLLLRDEHGWRAESAGTESSLDRVYALDASHVYATSNRTVRAWDGVTWSSSVPGTTFETYSDVWASATDDVYVTGNTLHHWNGTSWSNVTFGGSFPGAITGTGPTDLWVSASSHVWHYDGAWTDSGICVGEYVKRLWHDGPTIYLMTSSTLCRWDGTLAQWVFVGNGISLRAAWGSGPDDLFLVGDDGVQHFDGTEWVDQPIGTTASVMAIWGTAGDDVLAALNGGGLLHYDGIAWTRVDDPAPLDAVTLAPSGEAWAAGAGGKLLRGDGVLWWPQTLPSTSDLHAVWASDTATVAVGDSGDTVWRDAGGWRAIAAPSAVALHGVTGVADDDVWAVGDDGTILHGDGATWAAVTSPTTADLAAVSADWAVGAGGTILAFDGATWTAASSPTTADLRAVWSDWAVGAGATALRFDGASWIDASAGLAGDLVAVTGTAPDDVVVLAADGAAFHWNGVDWAPVRLDLDAGRAAVAAPGVLYTVSDAPLPQRLDRSRPPG